MITRTVTVPELGMIAGTRMALGAGIGLLLADHFKPEQKRAIGWTLLAVGAVSTIPLAAEVLLHHHAPSSHGENRDNNVAAPPDEEMVSSHSTL
jgi:hypothetical protein